jgi:SNF2 family DNA or RNA helicase
MTTFISTDDYMKRNKAMAIPGGYWDRERRAYAFDDPTPRTALIALKLFPELAITHPELGSIRDQAMIDVRPLNFAQEWWDQNANQRAAGQPLASVAETQMAEEGMSLHHFQRVDLTYLAGVLRAHGAAYLGWERGLGKTLGSIILAENLGAKRILVVSSNTAKNSVWKPEWARWATARGIEAVAMPNDKAKREALANSLATDRKGQPIVVFAHYESLQIIAKMRARNRGWDRIGEWDLIVADEAHHLANKNTLQTQALKRIPTTHKLAVSGSIISNHAGELYSQLNWLFPKRYSNELRDWNDRYLDWVELEGHREYIGVRVDRLPQLRDELGRYMVYRRKHDELDLPPITIQDLPVELSARQRRLYDDLARDAIATLDNGDTISAANGLALLTQLRQVATGLAPGHDDADPAILDSSKLDAAVELIKDSPDEAVLVFSYFIASAEALAGRLRAAGVETYLVTSKVSHADREQFIREFQAGQGRVFVGTLGTLGESVTLSRASNVIFLDRAWNPQLNDQSIDRVAGGFRAIQVGRPITVSNLVATGTVDESRVTPVLSSKEAVRAVILGRGRAPVAA